MRTLKPNIIEFLSLVVSFAAQNYPRGRQELRKQAALIELPYECDPDTAIAQETLSFLNYSRRSGYYMYHML
jgi:hypothetical protein